MNFLKGLFKGQQQSQGSKATVKTAVLSTQQLQQKLSSTWTGQLTQEQLMQSDMCILVDSNDKIIGQASKKDCHIFSSQQSKGILHRAFSLFLFDADGKLLLQQRASSKITFPSVWTNTCCSHPLTGMDPPEQDEEVDVKSGNPLGVKNAAIRKIDHELGIRNLLNVNDIKFLTRVHYCARDVGFGEADAWGEHEMDYILFAQTQKKIEYDLNPEEIDDVKFVSYIELKEMMENEGLKWSPWFRIIVDNFLKGWWENLQDTIDTDKFVDGSIHKLNVGDLLHS